jgi:hypothetical protein
MSDYGRFKAIFEQPQDAAPDLPAPSKGDNGPRFAAVAATVAHVAGTLEAFTPKDRAKKAVRVRNPAVGAAEALALVPGMAARLLAYMIEREAIRVRKEAGQPWPWTDNPVLQAGSFCNIRSSDDAVNRWVRANVIEPNRGDPDLVLKVALARFLNEPAALQRLNWTAAFNLGQIREVLEAHQAAGGKLFRTEAYKPPMPGKGEGMLQHLFEVVLPPLWHAREELRPREDDTLDNFAARWEAQYKVGSFYAWQITAGMKWVVPLCDAPDFWDVAGSGPGSRRGLNRVCGRPVAAGWSEAQWLATLKALRTHLEPECFKAGLPRLDLQDWQNNLCEFDKFLRAEAAGKPSRPYHGAIKLAKAPKAKHSKNKSSEAPDQWTTAAEPATESEQQKADTRPNDPGPHRLDAALDYAARGWRIFPAVIKGKQKKSHKSAKHSGGVNWGATRDPEQIKRDFARWPDAAIGIPTGPDNGFFVLEADTKQGGHAHDGMASLQALMAQHGLLPDTRMALSPSGSWHYYFRWPEGQTVLNSTSQVGPGLDVRGDGGMVIAPPSKRGDGAYRWISEAPIAEAPQWLLDLVAEPTKDDKPHTAAADTELLGPLCDIAAALDTIANPDLDWESWNKFGMAIYAASGGSEEGFALFDTWSQKSGKYDADTTREKWQAIAGCPRDRIGFDFLAAEANKADPEWRLKAARANTEQAKANGPAPGPEGQRSHDAPPELLSVSAATIDMEALEWLWPGRFALGKLGLIAGLPDEGKGLLTTAMAARATNPELTWPCGEGKAPQGNVILFTAEDDLADTVVPRLVAAGAKLDHVHIIKLVLDTDKHGKPRRRMFSLVRDLERLRAKIAEIGNVVLIIIDPITAYLGVGEVDSFRDADVRAVLAPLQDLAAELHAAVIAIMHFNKKVDVLNLLLRVCNSIAFTAAARHAFGVVYDADNHRRLLVRGKNNLTKRDDRALAFRVDAYEVGHDKRNGLPIEAPFLIWEADYVDITATEALQAVNEGKMVAGSRNTAKKFLQQMLRDGPVAAAEIEKAAKAEGIAIKTLNRAKQELGIVSIKDGASWTWQLRATDTGEK